MRPFLTAAWPCAILLILGSALQSPAVASSGAGRLEWPVLTRANFSSQIRLHPHVLLLATMPCEPSCPCLHLFSDEFHSRLGLVGYPRICLNPHVLGWIGVEHKLIYTPIYLNACGLRRI